MEANNELKIELFPNNKSISELKKESIKFKVNNYIIHSLDINKNLGYLYSNVPVLQGFYEAHCHHYPIRIKPDDIWLLIIQSFNYHINANFSELSNLFVNYQNKKNIEIDMDSQKIDKKYVENCVEKICAKMEQYLGKQILETLSPDFSSTNIDSKLVCKMTIMSIFKKYFSFSINLCVCGIPYIILEGTNDDYKKIIEKCEQLKTYKFDWYIDRIIPVIQKMVEAKEGKIDVEFFKNIVIKNEVDEEVVERCHLQKKHIVKINGWILKFFGYTKSDDDRYYTFEDDEIDVEKFYEFAGQILTVPFVINNNDKKSSMIFEAGFFGCDQNEKKEVYPVIGWGIKNEGKKPIKHIMSNSIKDKINLLLNEKNN